MRNKELKPGDKVWLYSAYMSRSESGYTVKSVKKSKTLVTVVVETKHPYHSEKVYEFTLYGHCNSRILSGFDRVWGCDGICYTCDYDLIEIKSRDEDRNSKLKAAGKALLDIVEFFK